MPERPKPVGLLPSLRRLIRSGKAGKLSSAAQAVLYVMVIVYVNRSGEAWPGLAALGTSTGLSRSWVKHALAELRQAGLLEVVQRGGSRQRHTTRFRVCLPENQGQPSGCDTENPGQPSGPVQENQGHSATEQGHSGGPLLPTTSHKEGERPLNRAGGKRTEWSSAAVRVYEAFPRHTDRKPALAAIADALAEIERRGQAEPEAWLLSRVRAYAEAVEGEPLAKVKSPRWWFADGNYDDDEAAWQPGQESSGYEFIDDDKHYAETATEPPDGSEPDTA